MKRTLLFFILLLGLLAMLTTYGIPTSKEAIIQQHLQQRLLRLQSANDCSFLPNIEHLYRREGDKRLMDSLVFLPMSPNPKPLLEVSTVHLEQKSYILRIDNQYYTLPYFKSDTNYYPIINHEFLIALYQDKPVICQWISAQFHQQSSLAHAQNYHHFLPISWYLATDSICAQHQRYSSTFLCEDYPNSLHLHPKFSPQFLQQQYLDGCDNALSILFQTDSFQAIQFVDSLSKTGDLFAWSYLDKYAPQKGGERLQLLAEQGNSDAQLVLEWQKMAVAPDSFYQQYTAVLEANLKQLLTANRRGIFGR